MEHPAHILRLERPEYIFHKVGPTLQQLKFKYEFAWALLHERPFLRKLIQTLHVKLIGYVFGQLGVEKCIRNSIFLLPSVWGSRMSLLQCSTRGQMTVKTGMTGLPLVPGAPTGAGLDAANMARNKQPFKDHCFCDTLVMAVFCAELEKAKVVEQLPEHTGMLKSRDPR